MEANNRAAMREADASRSDKILQAKSGFVVQGQEVFGRYCKIEMMRYGAPNEFFIHKCITILNSNFYTDVPVVCGKGNKWHEESVDVVSVITCGVDESKVFRVPLKDVEFVSMPSNCYGQSDQMTSYGNEAAMREALVIAKKAICNHARANHTCDSLAWETSTINANCGDILCAHRDLCEAKTAIQKALFAPARNCDLARDWLQDLYCKFKPPAIVRREMPPEWVDAVMAFCKWLLALADERKGEGE